MTDIVERLRVWPAAYGEDAMSSTYVGDMAKNAADEIERLRAALRRIANPIAYFREYAKEQGRELDGHMAVHISNESGWLKSEAAKALSDTRPDRERQS